MSRFRLIFIILTVCIVSGGCSDDRINPGLGSGHINPMLIIEPELMSGADGVTIVKPDDVPDITDFMIRFSDDDSRSEWSPLVKYPEFQRFLPGTYMVEMTNAVTPYEGFDTPHYYGSATVNVTDGTTATAAVHAKPVNTAFKIRQTEAVSELTAGCEVILHSDGGVYMTVGKDENRMLWLRGGDVSVTLRIMLADSTEVNCYATTLPSTLPGYLYTLTVDAEQGDDGIVTVIVSTDDNRVNDDVRIRLTPDFINAKAPEVLSFGFNPDMPVQVSEGMVPYRPIGFKVIRSEQARLILTTEYAPELTAQGWPAEVDLPEMKSETYDRMRALGLEIDLSDSDTVKVMLTDVLASLRLNANRPAAASDVRFTMQAVAHNGKTSMPVTMRVDVRPVMPELLGISDVVVGIDRASIRLRCPEQMPENLIDIMARNVGTEKWIAVKPDSISRQDDVLTMEGRMPDGDGALEVRIAYCGNIVCQEQVQRVSPPFEIEVDAFALKAYIRVKADNPELNDMITRHAKVYIDGEAAHGTYIAEDNRYLLVGGLRPSTRYRVKVSVMDNPSTSAYAPEVTFETEAAPQPVNGDFEEIGRTIEYKNMASGGRYSQNIVEIFNRQNYSNIVCDTPAYWDSQNKKTFCTSSDNINTWYMAPSTYIVEDAFSGFYAVRIDCVGYDHHGEQLPDFVQPGLPYTPYSRNIPYISGRSAGRLFAGYYSYDPATDSEYYAQGLNIKSRPQAVNGYYKYVPTLLGLTEKGFVEAEVLGEVAGETVVIARNRMLLSPAQSYVAFSMPLTYEMFGVKATSVRVMLCASDAAGELYQNDDNVSLVFDPVTSTARGNSLWVDNISFSY